jgi:hypothetical protein
MSAPEIISQTSENAQRLLDRTTKLASKRERSSKQQACRCAGYLVTLSADYDKFGGELGPLKLGETGTIIGSEGEEKLRFESMFRSLVILFSIPRKDEFILCWLL